MSLVAQKIGPATIRNKRGVAPHSWSLWHAGYCEPRRRNSENSIALWTYLLKGWGHSKSYWYFKLSHNTLFLIDIWRHLQVRTSSRGNSILYLSYYFLKQNEKYISSIIIQGSKVLGTIIKEVRALKVLREQISEKCLTITRSVGVVWWTMAS